MKKDAPFKEQAVHRFRSLQRAFIAIGAAAGAYFIIRPFDLPEIMNLLIAWLCFCLCYLFLCWYVIYTMPQSFIIKRADEEDGSRAYVFLFILAACFACLAAVLSIIINARQNEISKTLLVPVSVAGMILSWLLLHTIYTFHYAHLYYQEGSKGSGLDFPGTEKPDYLDFAYFSLVMGCTFQVSDVSITSRNIRHVALYHGVLSFALNTFVVALTINIISGLIH